VTGPEALDAGRLPWLLFRLAGRVPDDGLAIMRTCVADREDEEAVDLLAAALGTGRLPLTEGEAEVARAVLREHDGDPALADLAPQLEGLPEPPYRFLPPADGDPGAELVDAAVTAADVVGGLGGLWRVQRSSARATVGVWLAEADRSADAVELTAEMQEWLAEAGEIPPRLEVFTEGTELTPYHEAALAEATLVWTPPEASEPLLARVFDGANPRTGPFFAPDHPRIDGAERERLLAYLRAADTLLTSLGYLDDILDPANAGTVPVSFRCDGRWIWTDTVTYYLDKHGMAPDPDLQAHVLAAAGGPPPRLSRVALHRAMQTLTAPDPDEEGDTSWQAD
jgi:hypothetical protein